MFDYLTCFCCNVLTSYYLPIVGWTFDWIGYMTLAVLVAAFLVLDVLTAVYLALGSFAFHDGLAIDVLTAA